MSETSQVPYEEDPYADVPPPAPTDGPQEPVDESDLEPVGHATLPPGVDDDYESDTLVEGEDLVAEAVAEAGEDTVNEVLDLAGSEG